jgi:hypothetical protein
VLDYLWGASLLVLPRAMGACPNVADASGTLALSQLTYTALTDHEGGLYHVIPLRTHLVLDMVGGAALATLPFMVDEEDEAVSWLLVGMGLFSIAAAAATRTGSSARSGKEGGFVTPEPDWLGSRKAGLGSLGTPVTIAAPGAGVRPAAPR